MADPPETFVARWSRRKRSPRDSDEAAVPAAGGKAAAGDPAVGDPAVGDPAVGDPEAGDPEVIAKLPDIDSLDETSDFKPFMAKGVPEVLRRQALRKLWRLNPVFAHLDGLNDYDENYTLAATALAEVKTVYKVGKGMFDKAVSEDRTAAAEPADAEAADAETADAETEGNDEAAPVERAAPATADASHAPSPDAAGLAPLAVAEDARPQDASVPSGPTGPAAAPDERAPALRGDAKPARPRRRLASSRRWGESSQ